MGKTSEHRTRFVPGCNVFVLFTYTASVTTGIAGILPFLLRNTAYGYAAAPARGGKARRPSVAEASAVPGSIVGVLDQNRADRAHSINWVRSADRNYPPHAGRGSKGYGAALLPKLEDAGLRRMAPRYLAERHSGPLWENLRAAFLFTGLSQGGPSPFRIVCLQA